MNFEQAKKPQHQEFQILETLYTQRTFVFQRLQTHQSQIIDCDIALISQKADLFSLFEQYCPLKDNKVSIYNPQTNNFMQLSKINAQKNGKIAKDFLQTKIILIRFKEQRPKTSSSEFEGFIKPRQESNKERKDRSKQRTIGESIQLVKQWRSIHFNSITGNNKKLSLFQAAKIVGVSKKSLDDYYYQLRLGEYYNFDFQNHLDQKIGILRAYVKQFKPQRENLNKNMRHPKFLKIIGVLEEESPITIKSPILDAAIQNEDLNKSFKSLTIKQEQVYYQKEKESYCGILDYGISSLHNIFFNNFEFLLDHPNDPFINCDLQKKGSNHDLLFF